MHLTRFSAMVLVCGTAAATMSCGSYSSVPDDAGHEAFVRMVIPTLLGRPARGAHEIDLLVTVAQDQGRAAVVDVLLEQPELVSYWTQVLIDDLMVDRGGSGASNANCYGAPTMSDLYAPALIEHLAVADPTTPFCPSDTNKLAAKSAFTEGTPPPESFDDVPGTSPYFGAEAFADARPHEPTPSSIVQDPRAIAHSSSVAAEAKGGGGSCIPFTMTDVVRAGVISDRVFPIYRAYLAPMSTFTRSSAKQNQRIDQADRFMRVYLKRDASCMGCHTTTFSRTDARPLNGMWDRYEPVALDVEGSAFSYRLNANKGVYGGDGGEDVKDQILPHFRTDIHNDDAGAVGGASVFNPWGFADACVQRPSSDSLRDYHGFSTDPLGDWSYAAALAGRLQSKTASLWDLADILAQGEADALTAVTPPYNGNFVGNITAASQTIAFTCQASWCHGNTSNAVVPYFGDPTFKVRLRAMSNHRLRVIIRDGSGQMPPQSQLSNSEITDVVSYMRSSFITPYDGASLVGTGEKAVHLLLAANIVNNVVEEIMGEPLTLDHGHPRNADQRDILQYLTSVLTGNGGSLKGLLRTIVLSEAFARKAPSQSTLGYDLPAVPNPWATVAPGEPAPEPPAENSVGDFVHRRSVAHLTHSLSRALMWPAPQAFGYGTVGSTAPYPQQSWLASLGRYVSPGDAGVHDVDLGSFLAWEEVVTSCEKPAWVYDDEVRLVAGGVATGGVIGGSQWEDWVDIAAQQASGQQTILSVVLAMKDRVLNDRTVGAGELGDLETMFGSTSLATDTFQQGSHEAPLRAYCGVLLRTPHFLLGGIDTHEPSSAPATFTPCADVRCDYESLCAYYKATLLQLGYQPGFICPGGSSGGSGGANTG